MEKIASFMLILFLSNTAWAELITGIDTLYNSGFVFSDTDTIRSYDIYFGYADPGGPIIEAVIDRIVDMGEVDINNVETAPDTGYSSFIINYSMTHVYCVKTLENKYAKFMILGETDITRYIIIQWFYQNDGTKSFKTTGTRSSCIRQSWGKLKSFYQ